MTKAEIIEAEKELSERQCPECRGISYYGDWILVKTMGLYELQCPKCGALCDNEIIS